MSSLLPADGRFDLLQRALGLTGLDVAIAAPGADLTVLAPTDAAFLRLAQGLGYTGHDEDGAFGAIAAALAGLSPEGDPIPLLADILRYHVLDGARARDEIVAARTLPTLLEGASLSPFGGAIGDGDPDAADPRFVPGERDIAAGGVLVQPIDGVLLPIDVPGLGGVDPAPPTIAGILAASGEGFDSDGGDFDVLLAAAEAAGLTEALADPAANLTVFAPTDGAFAELARTLGAHPDGEQATFEAIASTLAGLAPDGDPIPLLRDVLLHHVVDGRFSQAQAQASGPLATLAGGTIAVSGVSITDADPDVRDARFVPGAGDVPAANGAVQPIDRVLLPLDLETADDGVSLSIAGELAKSGEGFDGNGEDFDILNAALGAAGLTAALDDASSHLTLFAPTDGAFVGLAQAFGFSGDGEEEAFGAIVDALAEAGHGDPIPLLTGILAYHVTPGVLAAEGVVAAETIPTLSGEVIAPDGAVLGDLDPSVPDPEVIVARADLRATNGLVHAIEGVLLPFDAPLV
ncbi:MAG: fasciclin domain-containing protein [Acetobacteraceae bacterium]|nr:fasciclin domain-containing protein [Acetobacteraceae bacterium]